MRREKWKKILRPGSFFYCWLQKSCWRQNPSSKDGKNFCTYRSVLDKHESVHLYTVRVHPFSDLMNNFLCGGKINIKLAQKIIYF